MGTGSRKIVFLGSNALPMSTADNHAAICELLA
jgi:hypothetical protein